MALCDCGITSSVIEYAGKVVLTLLPATLRSGVWRTMALRFALAVLPHLRRPGGREVRQADAVGDGAGGFVQHQNGERGIVSLRGEDGEHVRIAGGGGDAGFPELAAVAIVVEEDLERMAPGSVGAGGPQSVP